MFVAAYKNTERTARPKLDRPRDEVVVRTYHPREKKPPRGPSWREQVESAWAIKQYREKLRLEAIDKALRMAAHKQYRIIEVRPIVSELMAVKDIIRIVAERHQVTPAEILGRRRSKQIMEARHEAICEAAKARPDMTLPALGRHFGGRDHTSILHALRKGGVPSSSIVRQQRHLDRET